MTKGIATLTPTIDIIG